MVVTGDVAQGPLWSSLTNEKRAERNCPKNKQKPRFSSEQQQLFASLLQTLDAAATKNCKNMFQNVTGLDRRTLLRMGRIQQLQANSVEPC